ELALGDRLAGHPHELLADDVEDLGDLGRPRLRGDAERGAVLAGTDVGIDGVGEPTLLAHARVEPGGRAAAQDVRGDREREIVGIGLSDGLTTEDDRRLREVLLDRLALRWPARGGRRHAR